MTGLKHENDGKDAVNILYNTIKGLTINQTQRQSLADKISVDLDRISDRAVSVVDDTTFRISNFDIVLINSDYSANFLIKRDILHKILIQDYDFVSSYEPCTYPGVNSKYYWNQDYTDSSKYKRGVCYCTNPCNGKGEGSGNGNCKKVTIAIFQSGKLIITGAKTYVQINDAYDFINNVFRDHYQSVKREIPAFLLKEQQEKDAREAKVKEEKEKNREAKKIVKKQNTYPEKLTPPKGATIRWIKVEK